MSPFLTGITWLLLFQCAGEAASRLLARPCRARSSACCCCSSLRAPRPRSVGTAADALAKHLSLLFVPAGVGVMMYFSRLASEWIPIAIALLMSTVAAIAASALTFAALARRREAVQGAGAQPPEP
jgi:holin-like protein